MDTEDIETLAEDLGGNIDDLEKALAPMLNTSLSSTASKLPLLDKAKLNVLSTYAIESILFSALRLNGVDAKAHPVFQELNRVKEYFAKIKTAETTGTKRSTAVDKDAAGRFIKHGLAGNERFDRERAERQARERGGAKRKLEDMAAGTHTRFDGAAKRIRASEDGVAVVRATDLDDDDEDMRDVAPEPVEQEPTSSGQQMMDGKAGKRVRNYAARMAAQKNQAANASAEWRVKSLDTSGAASGATNSHDEVAPVVQGFDNYGMDRPHPPPSPVGKPRQQQQQLKGPAPHAEGTKGKKKKKRKNRKQAADEREKERADEMK